MIEEWRAVHGFEGQYEVSNVGRVRSLDRFLHCDHYDKFRNIYVPAKRKLRGKMLKPGTMASGHQFVVLGRGNGMCVHKLVLEAFVCPRPEGMECCHYDDNPANNRVENLRWDTRKANMEDYERNYGRRQNARENKHVA